MMSLSSSSVSGSSDGDDGAADGDGGRHKQRQRQQRQAYSWLCHRRCRRRRQWSTILLWIAMAVVWVPVRVAMSANTASEPQQYQGQEDPLPALFHKEDEKNNNNEDSSSMNSVDERETETKTKNEIDEIVDANIGMAPNNKVSSATTTTHIELENTTHNQDETAGNRHEPRKRKIKMKKTKPKSRHRNHHHDYRKEPTPPPPPFFIVSTVDGSIGILNAWDGSLVGGFDSGTPLVGPSEMLSGGRRIVPGLDGRLYISLEHQEGLLQPLEITVIDVLQTPVKTCSSGSGSGSGSSKSCGIVTATKSTSLFAIDAHSGRLVWKQSPNGTTIVEEEEEEGEVEDTVSEQEDEDNDYDYDYEEDNDDDHDDFVVEEDEYVNEDKGNIPAPAMTSTVLLQREDVLVQQLSTDSGRSVWNCTLGTVQALEFGEGGGGGPDGSSLPSNSHNYHHHHDAGGPYLPSGGPSAAESREVLMQGYFNRKAVVELPSVIFGPDGTSLMAVTITGGGSGNGNGGNDIQVLWKRDFPTVVASVFGLQDKTWKPLTVLEDPNHHHESTSTHPGGEQGGDGIFSPPPPPPQLGAESLSSQHPHPQGGLLTVYRPPVLEQLFSYWTNPMSILDRLRENWFFATGQPTMTNHRRQPQPYYYHPQQQGYPTTSSSSYSLVVPKKHTLALLVEHHDYVFAPPRNNRLALPSSPNYYHSKNHDEFASSLPLSQHGGIFLTWPILIGICIVVVGVAALIFRYLYLQKKTKWIQSLQQMAIVGLVSPTAAAAAAAAKRTTQESEGSNSGHRDDAATGSTNHQTSPHATLKRSHSLPDVMTGAMKTSTNNTNTSSNMGQPSVPSSMPKRRLRSESLQICHTADGRLLYDTSAAVFPKRVDGDATSATLANTNNSHSQQAQQQLQQPQGVDFLVDGIPLIRYNRYDSEFSEVIALGKGGFGTVFRCKNVLDGREYAIKKVALKYKEGLPLDEFRERLQRTLREVKSLALLDHPNIVRYYTAWLELHQPKTGVADPDDSRRGSQTMADSDYYLLSPDGGGGGATTTPTKSRHYFPDSTSQLWMDQKQQGQRRPSLNDRHYLKNGYQNSSNPLGAWNNVLEGDDCDDDYDTRNCNAYSMERSFRPFMPGGVPAALDDYGFTFDRGDDEEDDKNDRETPDNCAAVAAANESTVTTTKEGLKIEPASSSLPAPEEKSKSIGFFPRGPIIHRYSSNYSSGDFDGEESSIEGSNTGAWSSRESRNQGDRQHHSSITDTSTDDRDGQLATVHQQSKHISSTRAPPALMVKHTLYIQMQFCSQKTLADFLSNADARKGGETSGRVDIPYALSLFVQVAQGVQHVHGQGLIHRDLKPNNCFMDDSGVVKVGDFGLSRESANDNPREEGLLEVAMDKRVVDDTATASDIDGKEGGTTAIAATSSFREITAGVGTRSYASPEQMKGSDYDSSTDIYSLGIMLFELCYPMYTGMERTIVLSKLRNHIFPEQWMDSVEPAFPTLHSLLQSMISNSPADRPTAIIVVRSIQTILEGFTISSIDKHHHEGAILLRVEAKPREDVLRHTMNLVKEAACPECIDIAQYGLRGGTNKAVMEFAVSSSTCQDQAVLGNTLVHRLSKCDEILLIRQVSGTKYTLSQ